MSRLRISAMLCPEWVFEGAGLDGAQLPGAAQGPRHRRLGLTKECSRLGLTSVYVCISKPL